MYHDVIFSESPIQPFFSKFNHLKSSNILWNGKITMRTKYFFIYSGNNSDDIWSEIET